jgi:SAM-dependent methyltransferase
VAILTPTIAGPKLGELASKTSMTPTDIVARHREALDARDAVAFAQLYAEDAEITAPNGDVFRGREGAAHFFELQVRGQSRRELEVESESVDGATVTLEGTAYAQRSTAAAAAAGPKRKLVLARFVETFVVVDGAIRVHKLLVRGAYRLAPWEIGRPQSNVIRLAEDGFLTGRVLDVGCGTGENALFLAGLGRDVVGIDASETSLEKARTKARDRGLAVEFVHGDVTALPFPDASFDGAVDSGMLHILPPSDHDRFTSELRRVLRPNGRYFVLGLNDRAAIPGPRRWSRAELESIFAGSWEIEAIDDTTLDANITPGRPPEDASAWLARIRRV